jgi:hypothetical protein
MPETGFTGPVSELNRTTGSYPGSMRTRFSNRKPQSHAYAPLSPVLHYNPGQGDLVGGVQPAVAWEIPQPSRHKGRRPIPSKWGYPILLVRCTGWRSGPIAPCSIEQNLLEPQGIRVERANVLLGFDDEVVLVLLGELSRGADDILDQRC